jgi:hypothetical protein
MSGSNFRDHHLLLDKQSDEIYATFDQLPSVSASWAAKRFVPADRLPGCSG